MSLAWLGVIGVLQGTRFAEMLDRETQAAVHGLREQGWSDKQILQAFAFNDVHRWSSVKSYLASMPRPMHSISLATPKLIQPLDPRSPGGRRSS